MIDGGMIWPSVPLAQIRPLESRGEMPAFSIAGRLTRPSITTVAPMMPVEAAIIALNRRTESARPRADEPSMSRRTLSMFSASRERSRTTPISTNSGTAINRPLVITPHTRLG